MGTICGRLCVVPSLFDLRLRSQVAAIAAHRVAPAEMPISKPRLLPDDDESCWVTSGPRGGASPEGVRGFHVGEVGGGRAGRTSRGGELGAEIKVVTTEVLTCGVVTTVRLRSADTLALSAAMVAVSLTLADSATIVTRDTSTPASAANTVRTLARASALNESIGSATTTWITVKCASAIRSPGARGGCGGGAGDGGGGGVEGGGGSDGGCGGDGGGSDGGGGDGGGGRGGGGDDGGGGDGRGGDGRGGDGGGGSDGGNSGNGGEGGGGHGGGEGGGEGRGGRGARFGGYGGANGEGGGAHGGEGELGGGNGGGGEGGGGSGGGSGGGVGGA
eukprot:1559527-Prymnesium_polylepis.1